MNLKVFMRGVLGVVALCFIAPAFCFAGAPKSAVPRMIEVEEQVWIKQNEELRVLSDDLLKKETEMKLLYAEIDQLKKELAAVDARSLVKKNRVYRVTPGENLWKISNKLYKDPKKWLWIFKANENTITDPNMLYPEQPLEIPEY